MKLLVHTLGHDRSGSYAGLTPALIAALRNFNFEVIEAQPEPSMQLTMTAEAISAGYVQLLPSDALAPYGPQKKGRGGKAKRW